MCLQREGWLIWNKTTRGGKEEEIGWFTRRKIREEGGKKGGGRETRREGKLGRKRGRGWLQEGRREKGGGTRNEKGKK